MHRHGPLARLCHAPLSWTGLINGVPALPSRTSAASPPCSREREQSPTSSSAAAVVALALLHHHHLLHARRRAARQRPARLREPLRGCDAMKFARFLKKGRPRRLLSSSSPCCAGPRPRGLGLDPDERLLLARRLRAHPPRPPRGGLGPGHLRLLRARLRLPRGSHYGELCKPRHGLRHGARPRGDAGGRAHKGGLGAGACAQLGRDVRRYGHEPDL